MKKYLVLVFSLAVCLSACNSSKKQDAETDKVYKVQALLSEAEKLVDQDIRISGHVTHVCKHSGKRCFLAGDEGNSTIRVEATGDITAFDKELIGSTIQVKGTLKERRLTKEYIDNMEKEAHDKLASEEMSTEQCEAEISNVNDMRDWMKENNKDHYAIYYVDGLSYEKVD